VFFDSKENTFSRMQVLTRRKNSLASPASGAWHPKDGCRTFKVHVIKPLDHCLIDSRRVAALLWLIFLVGTGLIARAAGPAQLEAGPQSICVLDEGEVLCSGENPFDLRQVPDVGPWQQISLGHGGANCGIADQKVYCWGNASDGILDIPPLQRPYLVSVGRQHACAADESGIQCWGAANKRQLDAPALAQVDALDAGVDATCAISAGRVSCWGASWVQSEAYQKRRNVEAISVSFHACLVDAGVPVCWGQNQFGQATPPPLTGVTQIGVGGLHSCALHDGQVTCWGHGNQGQIYAQERFKSPKNLTVGSGHNCVWDENQVKCWGRARSFMDDTGEMAFSAETSRQSEPTETVSLFEYFQREQTAVLEVSDPTEFADDLPVLRAILDERLIIGNGSTHACLLNEGRVKCFGDNDVGQTEVPPLNEPKQVSAGFDFSCAISGTEVRCWGGSAKRQTNPPFMMNPLQIATGGRHACVLDGANVRCWGWDFNGQATVPNLNNPRQVTTGLYHSCALTDAGVKCWGADTLGQTEVPVLSNPKFVASGLGNHNCALDDSGVVCWGDNRRGQAQSLALVRPRDISVGYEHTCALDDSGVHCWGSNDQGQLEVPPLDQPVQVSVGGHHSCAEDTTGLVCWGAMGNEPVLVPPNLDF